MTILTNVLLVVALISSIAILVVSLKERAQEGLNG